MTESSAVVTPPAAGRARARWATAAVGINAAVVFGLIGFTAWSHSTLRKELADARAERDEVRAFVADSNAALALTERQLEIALWDCAGHQNALRALSDDLPTVADPVARGRLRERLPAKVDFRVHATALRLPGRRSPNTPPLRDYAFWIDGPADLLRFITRVEYKAVGPGPGPGRLASSNGPSGFRVTYRGRSAPDRIVVDIVMVNGRRARIDVPTKQILRVPSEMVPANRRDPMPVRSEYEVGGDKAPGP